jgi:L-ribulokinase
MTSLRPEVYRSDPTAADTYDRLFRLYMDLHDAFGKPGGPAMAGVMKGLLEIQRSTRET